MSKKRLCPKCHTRLINPEDKICSVCSRIKREEPKGFNLPNKKKRVYPKRGKTSERGYGTSWQRLRKVVLKRDGGLCQICLMNNRITDAEEIHHIKPLKQGGDNKLSNLISVCRRCHALLESMGYERVKEEVCRSSKTSVG